MGTRKIIATIEARMGSSRLPGKVLREAAGKPYLAHMIERVSRSRRVDEVVVATVDSPENDAIEQLAIRCGAHAFRGSEDDVLERVVGAAASRGAELIVQLTGDCPLMDPALIDECVEAYDSGEYDYVANELRRTYPIGFDVAVLSAEILAATRNEPDLSESDREHVTTYIVDRPERYRQFNVAAPAELDAPDLQLTLDTPEDESLLRKIFEDLYPEKKEFTAFDIIRHLRENPEIARLNANVRRKAKPAPDIR